ncbi:MAG TPA: UDP-N-acetylglucosamine--N-acetylmuramyl-(pentapeptide) pyrophosphoryl-undecaprenol N-acetylglucosamine transferase [Gemmatimonadaceae bacterium]|jgi:UDP-N-acetylglucosamine--N-acetylmuramyl-(pentapeptide) pyrophosphoryl-undecaprenol N-acetylglucosamine transferase|nr:UDP-N-acetylglucosamine--N-acetylmuramyl-(pentapeptide) pyrophosphoryl-undecaprenol N-acetylglucosamine transferase [Gemmatimonadaceae bacterium]
MRVIFAGGGTGGHLYPGLAIARALVKLDARVEPFFVGAERGIERQVLPGAEFPYALLNLHPLYRRTPWNNWRTLVGAYSAWRRIAALVAQQRPGLVVGTGGYASGLMLEFARWHRIPMVQQVGDSFPGLTARRYAPFCREIYLTFPEAAHILRVRDRQRLIDTGAPIAPPPDVLPPRAAAREAWGFPRDTTHVVLVYGGSQGARALNRAAAEWIAGGLAPGMGLIWMTGQATFQEFSQYEGERVRVRAYLSPIADAYAAADLAVARAGSMTTSELLAWHIPSILVPLPTAAADHQSTNAMALERAGAALHLPQRELTGVRLGTLVASLLTDPERLRALGEGAARRARPDAAENIARRILALVGDRAEP